MAWNIRGAAKPQGSTRLSNLIKTFKLNFIILTESHIDATKLCMVTGKMGNTWDVIIMEENGRVGGIIIAWNKEEIKVTKCRDFSQTLHTIVSLKGTPLWLLTIVYANTNEKIRNGLFHTLSLANFQNISWLVCGDFNCILHDFEKSGGAPFCVTPNILCF